MRRLYNAIPALLILAGFALGAATLALDRGWIDDLDRLLLSEPEEGAPAPIPEDLGDGGQVGTKVHPSAEDRPVIEPELQGPTPSGIYLVEFEIEDVPCWWIEELPELSSGETQLVRLPVPAAFEEWDDFLVEVWMTHRKVDDLYGGENLTSEAFGVLTGQSYTVPWLLLRHPIPWWWEGGTIGVPLFGVSLGLTWNLGHLAAFDGVFPSPQNPDAPAFSGASGALDGFVNDTNPGISQVVDQYTTLRWVAGRETVDVYFSPCLRSHFGGPSGPDWPESGVRCEIDGRPVTKGDQVGPGGGHGGQWPWYHEFDYDVSFLVRYVPREG